MEINTIRKNPMRVDLRIAYIYPSLYQVMISSLATDTIYFLVNSREEVYLERFHSTSLTDSERESRSLETNSPLRDFQLYLTTIHYEPDIVNLISILDAARVPVLSRDREIPIIAGGPAAMSNPTPYEEIIDAFIVGEAEVTLDKIIDLRLEYIDNKKKFLESIASLRYVYVPGYSDERVFREYVRNLDETFYPVRQIENTEIEPVFGRGFKLELSRGCRFWCSFCMESRLSQPYRERSYENLKKILERGSKYTISGRRVILYSLLTPASLNQLRFLEYLAEEGYVASIPSLRLNDLFILSSDLLDIIKRLRQRMITIAPETFSMRIQKSFFKYIEPTEALLKRILEIIDRRFDLKIYMIYGLKWEREEDIKLNIEILKKIARHARERGSRVSISLNPLIPKPHTVFQWIGMREIDSLHKILALYLRELRGLIEARTLDLDWGVAQAIISMSPKPLTKILIEWSRSGRRISSFKRLIRELDIRYVFEGYKFEQQLPWSKINLGEEIERVNSKLYEVIRDYLKYI
ncbi:MAG: radical SAM protein [Sulfolobales archaeon]